MNSVCVWSAVPPPLLLLLLLFLLLRGVCVSKGVGPVREQSCRCWG